MTAALAWIVPQSAWRLALIVALSVGLAPVDPPPASAAEAASAATPSVAATPSASAAKSSASPSPRAINDAEIRRSIDRGVAFLLARQNPGGSWGSAHNTKGLDIYAPGAVTHLAFRGAVTALCVSALTEFGGQQPEVLSSLSRGENWLLENVPKVRRATPDAIYNNWCHIYTLHALTLMRGRQQDDTARKAKIDELVTQQLDMLRRYECVDGGWAYYDFVAHTQQPSGSSISFVTAAGLISLFEVKQAGYDVSQKLVDRAVASIGRQRKPDSSYCYGEYLKMRPMHPVNRPAGSLGRSQACNLALRKWGDKTVTDQLLKDWLDRLLARNGWLDIGRKRPVPHEAWFAIAGYFYYFGQYYASRCIEELPPADRPRYQALLADSLLALQEKDGCWWDFPLYDYHQQYGTAFAIMTLGRCLREPKSAAAPRPATQSSSSPTKTSAAS